MLMTPGAKVFFGVAVLAFVLLFTGQVVSGNQTMAVLLFFLTASAAAAAVAVSAGSRQPETAPVAATVPAGAAPPQLTPIEPARAPRGGGWPALGAAAMGLMVLGFVISPLLAVAGVVVAAAAGVGWMASASADHTGRDANLLPLGLPVVGLFTIVSLMFFLSRVLLAVPDWGSTLIALLVAVAILGIASVLAMQPSVSGRTLVAILAAGGVFLLGGGIVAAAIGPRAIHHSGAVAAEPVKISAKDLKFDKVDFGLKSGGRASIDFVNDDVGVAHNVSIYRDKSAAQDIFVGAVILGVAKLDYKFPAPPPGTYYFRCDVHPFMEGNVTVS